MARLWALGALAMCTIGCGTADAVKRSLTIFVAASLEAPMRGIAADFQVAHPGSTVRVHAAGSGRLVTQLAQGAQADVLAPADFLALAELAARGVGVGDPEPFACNELAVVVARGNPLGIHSLRDLADPSHAVLLCGRNVPCGRYARAVIEEAGLDVNSRSDEPSVRAVVSKVALGEADAGICYVTDALAARNRVDSFALPGSPANRAAYPIVVLDASPHIQLASEFVRFAASETALSHLLAHGFQAP